MKPRVWTVFAAFVFLGVLTQCAVTTTGVTCAWWQSGEQHWLTLMNHAAAFEQTPPGFVICRLPAHAVLLGFTLLLGRWSRIPLTERLGIRRGVRSHWRTGWLLGASLVPLMCSLALSAWLVPPEWSHRFYRQFTPATAVIYLVYLTVLPGFVEELFFRGYVQQRLLQRWSPVTALIITAALFTVAHGVTIPILVTVFPVGLWLGLVAWRSNSIWPSCACHALFNAIWCGWPLLSHLTPWPDAWTFPAACIAAMSGVLCLAYVQPWLLAPFHHSDAVATAGDV